ncbi:U-box domain-containing protein 15 [Dichanthelium oligosanthes]|uniref:RING-type E3 ubiquitin transferase n=1 Tax=Dichanthelium oligosanthes TaxID=888268 RepID=A0A1E5UJY8_9POAL|nr:U-box domain-containing protein 15 [Dichanthelium oligosanthes]
MPPPTQPPPSSPDDPEPSVAREMDDEDLVEELLVTVNSARAFPEFRRTQRKECANLLRWLQLVLPLLEELRDAAPRLTDDAYRRLTLLGRALAAARRLLRSCHDGSKIFLALESETVLSKFRSVYEKMHSALDGMPYAELAISDEVKEQVELMNAQLMRCQKRTDTQDMELSMDLMVILQNKEYERNADRAILERLAKKLELQTLAELRAETMAIKKLINERNGQQADSTKQIIGLLNKFKEIAGIDEKNVLGDVSMPKSLDKCPSLTIPNDFLCPITLEIMTDPVIVASGQTYERRSIQKWLDSGERTCPKTRQPLAHLSLAPNYALKNLILQWCENNMVELQKREPEPAAEQGDQRKEDIPSLVEGLSSIHPDVQRKAVKKIRMLSKECPENRLLIADNGGIPALIGLLACPDKKVQENTVTSLLNLSIDDKNKLLITRGGAIPLIIEILRNGSPEAQENSAATLFSLSMLDENKAAIGSLGGLAPLVELLRNGTARGKKDAATAIFNLVLTPQNKARATHAGIVPALLKVIDDKGLGMVDEALSIFLLLSSHDKCRAEIGTTAFVEKLVRLIKDGTPKNKECALSVLLELGTNNKPLLVHGLRFGLHEDLSKLAKNGTSRAQRKANSLIQLARKL